MLCAIIIIVLPSLCEDVTFRIEEPIEAKSLSGYVLVGLDALGSVDILDEDYLVKDGSVLVEICTEDWKSVIYSTHTDENGCFKFPKNFQYGFYYLRLSNPDTCTLEVKAKIGPVAEKEKLLLVLKFS